MRKPSVVIIGAGVIGLTTAWQLVGEGAEVTVVDGPDQSRAISCGRLLGVTRAARSASAIPTITPF